VHVSISHPAAPRRRFRVAALAIALPLALSACMGAPAFDPTLTPAQNQLRQSNASWNSTVATGALAGAATGALAGAALSNNRGQGALIGGLIGLAGGLAAGALVAERNFTFANREASAQSRIENATAVANALEQQSRNAQQVVEQNRRMLADLDRQYRARQITAADYRARTQSMRADLAQMRQGVENGRQAREQINQVSGDLPALRAQEDRIRPAQRRLEASAAELEELLNRVPAV
jgi:outer membrane lipoprotein SlyB